jgi:hypothetical protein
LFFIATGVAGQAFTEEFQLHHHFDFHNSCSKAAGNLKGQDTALNESRSNRSFTCKRMSTASAWLDYDVDLSVRVALARHAGIHVDLHV